MSATGAVIGAADASAGRRSLDSSVNRPTYLNLKNENASNLGRLNQSSPSPASSLRLVSRMTTLHEEKPAISSLASPPTVHEHNEEERGSRSSSDEKVNSCFFFV